MWIMLNNSWIKTPVFDAAGEGGAGGGAPAGGEPPAGAGGEPPAGAGGAGGEGDFAWFGSEVDADTKQYLEAKSFTSPADLYKSLRGAEKMIRGDQIQGPPEDSEQHGNWFKESGLAKRLGVPEEAAGYGIEAPSFDDGVAELIRYDDDRHGRLMATAHDLNMTPAQVQGVLDFYSQEITADAQAFNTEASADEDRMKADLGREWGDNYDTNVTAALEVAKELGMTPDQMDALRVGGVAGSTTLTKILHELAQVRGNDTLKGGAGPGSGISQADAKNQLDDFMAKHGKELTDRNHPGHNNAKARLEELKLKAGVGSAARS